MAQVSVYLNFSRETEAAFTFYKSIFGTEYDGEIMRFSDMPPQEEHRPLPEEDQKLVMHVSLPILGGFVLMGSDAPESMGFTINKGNNFYINLQPDSRADTDRLFNALAEGGEVEMPLEDAFWGDYFGSLTDKFGIKWMLACSSKE